MLPWSKISESRNLGQAGRRAVGASCALLWPRTAAKPPQMLAASGVRVRERQGSTGHLYAARLGDGSVVAAVLAAAFRQRELVEAYHFDLSGASARVRGRHAV